MKEDHTSPPTATSWDVRKAISKRLQFEFNNACRRLGCEQGNNDEASIAMLKAIAMLDKWESE